jgi:hypothetical protein
MTDDLTHSARGPSYRSVAEAATTICERFKLPSLDSLAGRPVSPDGPVAKQTRVVGSERVAYLSGFDSFC